MSITDIHITANYGNLKEFTCECGEKITIEVFGNPVICSCGRGYDYDIEEHKIKLIWKGLNQ